jgi:hypothetical protein
MSLTTRSAPRLCCLRYDAIPVEHSAFKVHGSVSLPTLIEPFATPSWAGRSRRSTATAQAHSTGHLERSCAQGRH